MKKFILNTDHLLVGDIICTREDSRTSRLIRKSLSCDYSHVLIYVAHASCIHADSDGVHSINTQRLLFDHPSDAKVLRYSSNPVLSDEQRNKICMYAKSKIGTEYSRPDAVKAGMARKLKRPLKIETKYQFCSRLVAETYSHAGYDFLRDPTVCTPADVLDSALFANVDNVTREATREEIDFANDASIDSITKQTKITNNILRGAKIITKKDVQTFEDIFQEVIEHPEHDESIARLIYESGYLTIWADDVIKSPYRYFKRHYVDDHIIDSLKIEGINLELNMARVDADRFDKMRLSLNSIYEKYQRKTLVQQINLYQALQLLAMQRIELFEWLMEQKKYCCR